METTERRYTAETGGKRLDVWLTECTGKTRSQIKSLLESGGITCNGKRVKSGYICKAGDTATVIDAPKPTTAQPEQIPLDILYEDDDIAVINKPQGLSVHPGAGRAGGTLVNALLYRFGTLSEMGGSRPGIVHRLDKDTTGVLIVAKNDAAHAALAAQWAKREVRKEYLALCEGNFRDDSGEIRTCIGRSPRDRKKMAVLPSGKEAITLYRVVKRYRNYCLVSFDIRTGRTHQIRVHAQYVGHPVVGDKTYGFTKERFAPDGQLLHAASLTVRHPRTGQEMCFRAPLPAAFEEVLRTLAAEEI